MTSRQLILRGLRHYWRTNLAVVAGMAVAVAVLSGALLVGESVRASLRRLALERMGNTVTAIRAAGLFRDELADSLGKACPMLALEGLVRHQAGGRQATHVPVYGIDERFWKFHGRAPVVLTGRDAAISRPLAGELGSKPGDTLLVRIDKPSDIPSESLFGRKEDAAQAIRLRLKLVLESDQLGEFSLQPRQGSVKALFLPLDRLRQETGAGKRANVILSAEPAKQVSDALREDFSVEDLGVRLFSLPEAASIQMDTQSGILSDRLVEAGLESASAATLDALPVLTYLATSLRSGRREIPYSLVAAADLAALDAKGKFGEDAILLNEWAANDLSVRTGDRLEMEYLLWHDNGTISTAKAPFTVAGIVPIAGLAADRRLTPEYPGIRRFRWIWARSGRRMKITGIATAQPPRHGSVSSAASSFGRRDSAR
jgi:putative ABC transport system permease protein